MVILAAVFLFVGLLGCILPMLPGPPLAYAGMLLLHLTDRVQFTTGQLLVWLLVVVATVVLDYVTPLLGSKYSGGSKWGERGCIIGTVVGLFFAPWGIIIGPFVGAVVGELLGDKELSQALKSGFGSFLGFLFGTVLKMGVCGYFIWQFFKALF